MCKIKEDKVSSMKQTFDYCEMKNGSCSCKKQGEAFCAPMIREAQDAETVRVEQQKAEQAERDRKARYITDEPPRHPWFSENPFLVPMARGGRYFGPETIRVPLREEVDYTCTDETPMKTAVQQVEITRQAFARLGGDYAEIERRVRELLLKKKIITSRVHERITLEERRRGSIPKDKRKPHHAFLEDPVRRRR